MGKFSGATPAPAPQSDGAEPAVRADLKEPSPLSEPTLESRAGAGADHEESRAHKIFGSPAPGAEEPGAGARSRALGSSSCKRAELTFGSKEPNFAELSRLRISILEI